MNISCTCNPHKLLNKAMFPWGSEPQAERTQLVFECFTLAQFTGTRVLLNSPHSKRPAWGLKSPTFFKAAQQHPPVCCRNALRSHTPSERAWLSLSMNSATDSVFKPGEKLPNQVCSWK